MTDRFHSLTVVLDADTRDDDAQPLIDAIMMLKGVIAVKGDVADSSSYVAEAKALTHLRIQIRDILWK